MFTSIKHRYSATIVGRLATLTLGFALFSGIALTAQEAPRPGASSLPYPSTLLSQLPLQLDSNQQKKLLETGELTAAYKETPAITLCPDQSLAPAMLKDLAAAKPTIGMETLLAWPIPAAIATRADRDLLIYNILHRYRSMAGIEYFSQSRGKMRIFFNTSNVIKNPADRKAMPDPTFTAIEAAHTICVEQDDSTFGKNVYAVTVLAPRPGIFRLDMKNLEQVWTGIIPALGPQGLDLNLVIMPSADGKWLFFYGNAALNAAKTFGLDEKAGTSFYNRVIALYRWFVREFETVS